MSYLVDTGVWLRLFDRSDPRHLAIREALQQLRYQKQLLCATSQIVAEFWNASTRPSTARGGYGCRVDVVPRRVAFIERFALILPDSPAAYLEWKRLVEAHRVSGVAVHDARIVAQMIVADLRNVITLNEADFRRYSDLGIVCHSPELLLGA